MFTFGYRWRPWPSDTALADGELILDYVRTVAEEYGVDKLIRYRTSVVAADWDTATARWTVTVDTTASVDDDLRLPVGLHGLLRLRRGPRTAVPGRRAFAGQVVHPQFWPEDLDYAGKKVVVIGSGATAITLVPSMAETAAHVTMLQRSPTYILSQPGNDPWAVALRRLPAGDQLPDRALEERAAGLVASYQLARRPPDAGEEDRARRSPRSSCPRASTSTSTSGRRYNPWDQRLCVVPDSDLFKALRAGTASVVTDTIETFTPTGHRADRPASSSTPTSSSPPPG